MGNKVQTKKHYKISTKTNKQTVHPKQTRLPHQSNYTVQLLIFGYINQVFTNIQNNLCYNSIIMLSIPNDIYELCFSMYGLIQHRYIFMIENLSDNTCNLQHRNIYNTTPIQCKLQKKELLTNCTYTNCKSIYINNLKSNDHYVDIIALCGAENHYVSGDKSSYYASMITIHDSPKQKHCDILATCSVLPWCSYWNPTECSNLTYDTQYGLMFALHNVRRNIHSIYHLKLFDECTQWKQLIILNAFKCDHVFIAVVRKNDNRYLFVCDGYKMTKLYDLCKDIWISVQSNNTVLVTTAQICYDHINNRVYFIDISYCCYFDVDTNEWMRIAAPGYWATEEDVIYIKDYGDRHDMMIVCRNYYLTYNINTNKWLHRYTLDRDIQNETHDSYVLV